ncbi:MAG TPA: CsgG/HfaB family protein [bacterium]|nr:CsgG/HfaB family protein [bacterium]
MDTTRNLLRTARRAQLPVLLLPALLAACGTPVARYQARVPAQVDVGDIQRVAVADFDGLPQTGALVAAKITEGIVDGGHFRMFERSKLDAILNERAFQQSDHVDPATASKLKLAGVDALVFGTVDAYSVDDQTGVTKVSTEVGTGEYETIHEKDREGQVREVRREIKKTVMVDRGYVLREGTMGVTFRMADVRTGEIVAIRTETVNFSQKTWADERRKLPTKDVILEDLASRVTHRFLARIQPQTVVRAIRFEENENPNTEIGIRYAKAGLWDKAAGALRSAAVASPAVASAHYNLGMTYDALGDHGAAIDSIERALSIEPKDKYIQALAEVRRSADHAAALRSQEQGRN